MFQFGSMSHAFHLFPNITSGPRMSQLPPHNCTISYFAFFSKQEMCWGLILRHFFCLLGVLYLFFHPSPTFSATSEHPNTADAFFKKHAPSPHSIDIKNLSLLPKLYSESPLQMYVFYYLGCDAKNRSHTAKNQEKCLLKAIDYFAKTEMAWIRFSNDNTLPKTQMDDYRFVKEAAILNAADAYLQLAVNSSGMKKETLIHEAASMLKNPTSSPHQPKMRHLSLWLHILTHDQKAIDTTLSEMKAHPPLFLPASFLLAANYTYSYGHSADTLLLIEQCNADQLSPSQKLDLWVLQSLCLRDQGKLHEAHLVLSKAINSPVASAQRLRAMCLRASLYEEEGRYGLAAKQWEAVASKNGHWAKIAKNKVTHAQRSLSTQ